MLWAYLFVIAFGLVIGSFLNVLIHRIPLKESVVRPSSHCPGCNEPIRPWHNVPVLSFLLLRGRCAYCGMRIPWRYPLIEAATGLLFALLFAKYGFSTPFIVNAVLVSLVLVLMMIDLAHRLLPNVITFPGLLFGLAVSPLQFNAFFHTDLAAPYSVEPLNYVYSLLGIILGGGILIAVAQLYLLLRKIEGLGLGDVKMMAMVGAFLGWRYAWLSIFLGSFIGAIIGSLYIYLRRKGSRYELPFGSFLGMGAMASVLWGPDLVAWYLSKL
jgi:leader peptidase (prepilin peptidase) / N-methyltransferase